MKRVDLIKCLTAQGCERLREGSRHSWWHNLEQNRVGCSPAQ